MQQRYSPMPCIKNTINVLNQCDYKLSWQWIIRLTSRYRKAHNAPVVSAAQSISSVTSGIKLPLRYLVSAEFAGSPNLCSDFNGRVFYRHCHVGCASRSVIK